MAREEIMQDNWRYPIFFSKLIPMVRVVLFSYSPGISSIFLVYLGRMGTYLHSYLWHRYYKYGTYR